MSFFNVFTVTSQTLSVDEAAPAWLAKQAETFDLRYLLAFAYDGVIWGRYDTRLKTSGELAPKGQNFAKLQDDTLLEAYLFSPNAELHMWRTDNGFLASYIQDSPAEKGQEAFDQAYFLWGTESQVLENGFTLLYEGEQGFRHAAPVPISKASLRSLKTYEDRFEQEDVVCPRLKLRHYLNDSGPARITRSRLVDLLYTPAEADRG